MAGFYQCEDDEGKLDWMCTSQGAIRLNGRLRPGRVVCIVPDPEIVGRWNIVASYHSRDQAQAVEFARGYCAHRDAQLADRSIARSR